MRKLQDKLALRFMICITALILTTEMGQGWGWIIGWALFGWVSLVKLASHGGLDTNEEIDRKSTRLNSSHIEESRMPSSA